MVDFRLIARMPLDNYRRQFNDTVLQEVSDIGIVSIATRSESFDELEARISSAYGTSFPKTGHTTQSKDGTATFLGLQRELAFVMFEYRGDLATNLVCEKLGGAAYYSDQSDSWALLRVSGPRLEEALQRICMLDLALPNFPVGSVQRTMMEHIGVIVYRESTNSILLMSPRSFAESFLHVIETAILDVAE